MQHVLRVAAKAGVPVMPRGGGTGLSGQTVNHAIVMDFSPHMNSSCEVNVDDGWARAQPGARAGRAQPQSRATGCSTASTLRPQNRATIGGGVGNNSCGAHSIVYGKTIDNVLSLDAVLADASLSTFEAVRRRDAAAKLDLPGLEGSLYREMRRIGLEQREEIERRFPKILRRVSGYNLDDFVNETGPMDLSRMLVGSEGTLAVVTEAKLRLHALPKIKGLAAAHFRTIVEAAEATVAALEHARRRVELIDSVVVERCRGEPRVPAPGATSSRATPGGILIIEFTGDDRGGGAEQARRARRPTSSARASATTRSRRPTPPVQRDMWRMREAGLGLIMSVRGDAKAAPSSRTRRSRRRSCRSSSRASRRSSASNNTEAAYYGHASVGCLHIRPMVNLKTSRGPGPDGEDRDGGRRPRARVRRQPRAASTATASCAASSPRTCSARR